MDHFSAFTTADELDLDEDHIYGKGSLQEVETEAVVPVGRFRIEKEWSHTQKLRQIQPQQTRSPMDPPVRQSHQINNFSAQRSSEN